MGGAPPADAVRRRGRLEIRAGPLRAGHRRGADAIAVGAPTPAAPFPGVRAFRTADRAVFLARERETQELLDLVTVYRGVLLYGDSGTGKSSLVNAGLAPLAHAAGMHVDRLRVQPRAGAEFVVERRGEEAELLPSLLAAEDDGSPLATVAVGELEQLLHVACERGRPVLVLDQFEELVTLFDEAGAGALRRSIVDLLVELLYGPLPVKLLLAFREDYLGRVKQLLADCPTLIDQALRLAPPAREALPTLIRGPFERNPGRFERELSPALAAGLAEVLGERFVGEGVSLTEVQIVCLRLWQAEDPEQLLASAGIQGVLVQYLEDTLAGFAPELREAAIALLASLVTPTGTRNVVSRPDLVDRARRMDAFPRPLLERALDRLELDARLVRRERRRELDLYELTSEFFVPWIGDERERARRRRERRRLTWLLGVALTAICIAAVVMALAAWALMSAPR